jgi:hypothetical protein
MFGCGGRPQHKAGRVSRTVILAGGLIVCGLALAQEPQQPTLKSEPIPTVGQQPSTAQSQPTAKSQPTDAEQLMPVLQGIESAIRKLIPSEDTEQRRRQEEREKADLKAQEDMAFWAMTMFWATLATVLLTFAALIAIIRTLHHTRRAADYAKSMVEEAAKATNAANATFDEARLANEIARDGLIAQHRPWMTLELDSAGPVHLARPGRGEVSVELTTTNIGNSPALMTMYKAKAYWTHDDWPKMEHLAKLVKETTERTVEYPHANVVLPKDDAKFGFVRLQLNPVMPKTTPTDGRKFNIVILCCVVYQTALSQKWFHTARIIYVRPKGPDANPSRNPLYFKWSDGEVPTERLKASISKAGGTVSVA